MWNTVMFAYLIQNGHDDPDDGRFIPSGGWLVSSAEQKPTEEVNYPPVPEEAILFRCETWEEGKERLAINGYAPVDSTGIHRKVIARP